MDKLLTVDEVAARLRVHAETVRIYLRKRELEGVNRGGRAGWRIPESALKKFLAKNGEQPAGSVEPHGGCRVISVSNQKGGVGNFIDCK